MVSSMKTQIIIDCISYTLCAERDKTQIVVGNTVREAERFIENLAKRIPSYVNLRKERLGWFITDTGCYVLCTNRRRMDGFIRGRNFEMLYLLKSVNIRNKDSFFTRFGPVIKKIAYEI